jgi:N-acyl-D-aspartate/D-glutamate deacylase
MYSQRSNLSGRPLILPGLHAGLRVTRGFLISATILLFGTPDHPFTLSAQDPPNRQPISADILLRGGTVIDGTGSASQTCDVAIRKGQLILPTAGTQVDAIWEIDCTGLIVCPGFIDLHNHSDGEIEDAETRAAMNYVMQGCSTLVTGNCGFGPIKVAAYYDHIDEYGAGTNIAHLLPQGGLRKAVLDSSRVAPTEPQIQEMLKLAEQAMSDGAWGMSTGLIYVPSSYATTQELTTLAKAVAHHGGIYVSHIRGEGTNLLESVSEAIQIGRDADLPVHISHFKAAGRSAWGLVREATQQIEKQRAEGYQITADQYPYIASSTSLGATVLPSWAREGGGKELRQRLVADRATLEPLIQKALNKADHGASIRLARYKPKPKWVGKDLAAIAQLTGATVVEVAFEILMNGGASVVKFSMNEQDVRHVMSHPWVATASDGGVKIPGANKPHPRNYGTFPRKLGYYALNQNVIPIEQAIHSMTGLPAKILSMCDRGLLKTDMIADIAVFDPKTIQAKATFDHPHQYAVGIRYLFVNGEATIVDGKPTGALPGRALRHVSVPRKASVVK